MALTYQNKINFQQGLAATQAVTVQQRIDQCIKENCVKILNGALVKTALINNNQFTDQQLIEFALRGMRGSLTQILLPSFMQDAAISATLTTATMDAITDATLDSIFGYVVWPVAKLIGNGTL